MSFCYLLLPTYAFPTSSSLPYQQATTAQRAQVLHYLQARLVYHFPTLPERARARVLTRALAEFCPDLWYTGDQVALPPPGAMPIRAARGGQCLMQYTLHNRELFVWVLPELEASDSPCGPRLLTLLRRVMQPPLVAQQLRQAWRWDVPGGPALPLGIPGGRPAPDSPEVHQRLLALEQAGFGRLPLETA